MDSTEILQHQAVMDAFVRDTSERIQTLETCLDDLSAKLARTCQSDLTDQRVMRGLLDQTRMVTSTIRGYDKLIEMRMNMQAHRDAGQRHVEKLRLQQTEAELAASSEDVASVPSTDQSARPEKNNLSQPSLKPNRPQVELSSKSEKKYPAVPKEIMTAIKEAKAHERAHEKVRN